MLPPSDSLRHQSHKLAEMIASIQNGNSPPPPPPYELPGPRSSAHEETASHLDAGDEWESSPCSISICIDASISILGNSNTVIIPSVPGNQQAPSATSTTPVSPVSSAYATDILKPAQKKRQAKLTEMATDIIGALQESDLFAHSESGRRIPIEININTGVKIEGSRNVICAGTPCRLPTKKNVQTVQNEISGDRHSLVRKRRAQSVCPPHLSLYPNLAIINPNMKI